MADNVMTHVGVDRASATHDAYALDADGGSSDTGRSRTAEKA